MDKPEFFVHPHGICESSQVGKGTRIWAFAHILPGAKIGEDCNFCDHAYVENDVKIGNRVTVKNGSVIGDGVIIEDDVFVGAQVTFSNDPFPRSKQYREAPMRTHICAGASIGNNVSILCGVTIGKNAMVGMGSVVLKDVPDNAVVVGNPARVVRYLDKSIAPPEPVIDGVKWFESKTFQDNRGSLTPWAFGENVPFAPKRCHVLHGVQAGASRGDHVHKECEQFLICVHGSCKVHAENGTQKGEWVLSQNSQALYVAPWVWLRLSQFSSDATVLVFSSHSYELEDYLGSYQAFLENRPSTSKV